MTSIEYAADQLLKCSSTPLLHRILRNAEDLQKFSSEHSDSAATAFFHTLIGLINGEIERRKK